MPTQFATAFACKSLARSCIRLSIVKLTGIKALTAITGSQLDIIDNDYHL